MTESSSTVRQVLVAGSADIGRLATATLLKHPLAPRVQQGQIGDLWGLIVSEQPNILIIEIGRQHSARIHQVLRKILTQLRERFGVSMYVTIVLSAPEKLAFAGDLLFADTESLSPSLFVDAFIVSPPGLIPSIPNLGEQLTDLMDCAAHELDRRESGKPSLPALGEHGWVQSMADPRSRALWMRWLPRYASYTNENPIIIGQTGTGKSNLAYALHRLSGRTGKFVAITPRDFSSSELVQAELFGAVAGAYTGAVDKWGLVKSAEKGTLFIDELQSIDKDLQGKLITFIENKVYRRVGSSESISADVRFVFASNRTLVDMIHQDILRDDFAYRLERVKLDLLPLCERRLDIAAALAYSLAKIHRQRPQTNVVDGATSLGLLALFGYAWPGNLRQLENTVAQLCELADMRGQKLIDERIAAEAFESSLLRSEVSINEVLELAARKFYLDLMANPTSTLDEGMNRFQEWVRVAALELLGGDTDRVAELLDDEPSIIKLTAETVLARDEMRSL